MSKEEINKKYEDFYFSNYIYKLTKFLFCIFLLGCLFIPILFMFGYLYLSICLTVIQLIMGLFINSNHAAYPYVVKQEKIVEDFIKKLNIKIEEKENIRKILLNS